MVKKKISCDEGFDKSAFIDRFLLILTRTQQKVFSDLNEFHNVTVSNDCFMEKRHVFSLQKYIL